MRWASIRSLDVTNGEGVGIALFVQGCNFHCKDCFNSETWDFNGGKEWTEKVKNKFYELADKPHIKRISILGGEPLADQNIDEILNIVSTLKTKHPEKQIWVYTGYTYEEINNGEPKTHKDRLRRKIIEVIDVLCDGRFDTKKADPLNKEKKWVGSPNQRVIDIKETKKQTAIIEIR